jgi:hypothetical protein
VVRGYSEGLEKAAGSESESKWDGPARREGVDRVRGERLGLRMEFVLLARGQKGRTLTKV